MTTKSEKLKTEECLDILSKFYDEFQLGSKGEIDAFRKGIQEGIKMAGSTNAPKTSKRKLTKAQQEVANKMRPVEIAEFALEKFQSALSKQKLEDHIFDVNLSHREEGRTKNIEITKTKAFIRGSFLIDLLKAIINS